MPDLSPLAWFCSYLFLVSVMLSVGLQVTGRQVLDALKDGRLLGRALVANLVAVPLLGLVLVWLVPLPPDLAVGILILAAAPGAPFAVQFTSKARQALAFAAALLFVLTTVSLVVTPFLAGLLLQPGGPLTLPVGRVARAIIVYLAVPLLAGFALQRWAPAVARTLKKPAGVCAGVSFPAAALLTISVKSEATRAISGRAILVMLLLVLGGMLAGWLLGGPGTDTRRVLAISTGMRNVMVALLVAVTSFPESDVDVAVLAFSALMVPPNLIFTAYQSRRARGGPQAGAP